MADSTIQSGQKVAEQTSTIHRLIASTRRWLRSTWVATGLAVSLGLFVAVLVAVVLLDLASPLWPVLRFAGLMLVVIPTTWAFLVGVVKPLIRRLTQVMVARRIEQELPSIHNRLVSCVDLARNGQARQSRAFHQRLVDEAFDRIRDFRLRQVLDLLSLRRASVFAFLSVAALVGAFFLFSDRLPTAVARIFQPFADIPPVSGVLYDVLVGEQPEPGDCDVLRGEDVDFLVVVKKGEVALPGSPESLRLDVSTVDSEGRRKRLNYSLPAVRDSRTTFKLTGMQHSFTYRVRGGGTWSKQYRVTMLDRPRIVGLQTTLHYPKYMRLPEPRLGPPMSPDVIGPQGSTVEVSVDVQGDASEGEIELLEQRVSMVEVHDRRERVWFIDEMPTGAKKQGNWQLDAEMIGSPGHTDPPNAAAHAHGFERAPTPFEVLTGESLIAYVYLDPAQMPESVMLKFHDGKNWEHRAFWGADKIGEGKVDTPSRHHVGDLPAGGKLVRLEVPANAVDMEGQRIHGISFAMFGGKGAWGATGSLPPAKRRVTEFVATESFLLSPQSSLPDAESQSTKWSGKLPLERDGFYRVVLRNRLKYPNRQMDEGELTAVPDNSPQVVIERPAKDLVISEPIKVPVYITAYDDFGLDDVTLSFQMPDSSTFQGRKIRHYEPPKQNDHAIATIDLAAEGLQLNQTLRYRIEVRDTKGQSVTTEDRTIRIANDNNAADKQFARYQEKTESLQEKLEQLVEEQAKVETAAEELAEKYEDLTETIEQAQAEAIAKAEAAAEANQPPPEPMPIVLDEPAKKQLEELRAELAQVAPIEAKAVQLSKEVANELKQMADQSATLEMLPPEVAEQVQGVQEAFEQLAVKPLEELNNLVNEAVQPAKPDPQLPQIQQQAESVQQSLEDLQARIEAVVKAQETSREDVEQAVAELQQDVMQQNARIATRELTELRDALAEMREELGELGETQEALIADAEKDLSDPIFEKLVEAQEQLDAEADPVLADARELLEDGMLEQVRADADAPAAPLEPALAGPLEEPAAAEPDEAAKKKDKSKKQDAKKQDAPAPPLSPERQELQDRQMDRAEELATTEEALAADQEILESLIESLTSQLPEEALGELTPEQAAQLQEMLAAQTTQEALEMFRRLEQMLAQTDEPTQPNNQPPPPSPPTDKPDLSEIGAVDAILVELDDFDLSARTVIMKMQPREREDLLQGLKEEGPEGYRKFIRDYFRRLTKVQAVK
ncbi:MAG: hypothetical protein H8E66_30265 [Planctomycetes bacterium]|nr:hypothetical protein [Planctomycetota bacterium]